MSAPLPPGWRKATSKVGGKTQTYYYHTVTRQTATDPENLPAELPKHWEEAVDRKTGERYYWNVKTRETRQTPPGVEIRSGRLQSQEGAMIAPTGPSPSAEPGDKPSQQTPAVSPSPSDTKPAKLAPAVPLSHTNDKPAQVMVTVTAA